MTRDNNDKMNECLENILNNERFMALDSIELKWATYNLSDNYLDILLTIDNGKNWEIIKNNIVDLNKISIAIPFITKSSSKCKIKIVESNQENNFAISQGLFSITRPKGNLNLLSNNKKIYQYNEQKQIVWKSKYLSDKKGKLFYSTDKGDNWIYINDVDILKGNFVWDIPNIMNKSNQCMIKIEAEDAEFDYQDNLKLFTINAAPIIVINNNNSDTVKTNMPFTINTSIKNTNNNLFNLYYSLSNGINWTFIDEKIDSKNYWPNGWANVDKQFDYGAPIT